MNAVERGTTELLTRSKGVRRRHASQTLATDALRHEMHEGTGAEGDKRIEMAAAAGHTVASRTIIQPTEVGPELYHG